MQEEANHLLGQFQHKNKFQMANQGIKKCIDYNISKVIVK
jgi:hypothetical protein